MSQNINENCDNSFYQSLFSFKRTKFRAHIRSEKNKLSFNKKRFDSLQAFLPNKDLLDLQKQFGSNSSDFSQKLFILSSNLKNSPDWEIHLYELRCFLMDLYQNSSNFSFIFASEIPGLLLGFLEENKEENPLKIEASRCLLILTAELDSDCEKLIYLGIIGIILEYLDQKIINVEFYDILMTILANLCYCEENKQKMFDEDIVYKILNIAIINTLDNSNIMKPMLYLIKSLCIGGVLFQQIKYLLDPVLQINEIEDEEIQRDSLKIIAIMGEKIEPIYIESLLKQNKFMKKINELLINSKELEIFEDCLKIISNLTMGDNSQILGLIGYGIVKNLSDVLEFQSCRNQKKIMMIFSNILQENKENLQVFFKSKVFEKSQKFLFSEEITLKKETFEFFLASIYAINKEIIPYILCSQEIIEVFFEELKNNENDIDFIIEILCFIEYLMKTGVQEFEEGKIQDYFIRIIKFFEKGELELFEYHQNYAVSKTALRIQEFFNIFSKKQKNFLL